MSVGLRYASFELSCRRKTVIKTSNKNAAASAYGNHVAVAVMADIFSHSGARRGGKSDTRHETRDTEAAATFFSKRARKRKGNSSLVSLVCSHARLDSGDRAIAPDWFSMRLLLASVSFILASSRPLFTTSFRSLRMSAMSPMFVLDAFGKRQFNNPDYVGPCMLPCVRLHVALTARGIADPSVHQARRFASTRSSLSAG
jgi:hypothetical protein